METLTIRNDADVATLTTQIKDTLQAQGQLQSIRAQLRACVYGALSGKSQPPTMQKLLPRMH